MSHAVRPDSADGGQVSVRSGAHATRPLNDPALLDEQIRLLYAEAPVALVAALLVAVILAVVTRDQVAPLHMGAWLGALVVVSLPRFLLVKTCKRIQPEGSLARSWGAWYTLGALCAGAVWGALAFILDFSWPVEYQLLILMGLAGISAGAIPYYAVFLPAYIAFVIPATLPMAGLMLLEPGGAHVGMGILIIGFAAALVLIAGRYNQSVTRSLTLGRQAEKLAKEASAANVMLRNEIEKHIHTEEARNLSQEQASAFGKILDDSLNEIFIFDAETFKFVLVNQGARSNLGYSMEEMKKLTPVDIKPGITLEYFEELIEPLRSGKEKKIQFTTRHERKDGTLYAVEVHLQMAMLGALPVYVAIILDITERKAAEDKMRQAAIVFENTTEGVLIADANANILAVNKAFSEITGYSEEEVLGKNPRFLQSKRHDREFYKDMWSSLRTLGQWQGEIWDRRKNGEVYPKWMTISAVNNDQGEHSQYVSVFTDISAIKQSQERIHHLAHHDPLTDLPNRLLLNARLDHALQHARRQASHVAILYLDLDRFKNINDTLGHPEGDCLLKMVAERLVACVRDGDTVARLGGDELVIVLEGLENPDYAATFAQQVLGLFKEPFTLNGQDVFVTTSIGISICPQDGLDATTLLRNADASMYTAKDHGRNTYMFYKKGMTTTAQKLLSLETDLHHALQREEFVVYYQPQLSLKTGDIVGVEALIRWQHPVRGLVPPNDFIPLAEDNGLIQPIGLWVLRTACEQLRAWQNAGLATLRMAVNLSGRQITQNGLVQGIASILDDTGLDPRYLELEITESSVMHQADRTVAILDALWDIGVLVAIDDFGTGYSSLAYLKRFPVDRLKIDRSFISDLPHDVSDKKLVRAIVALGHSLNLKVIAEGVETMEQKRFLETTGCDEMQGFLCGKPMPPDELTSLLQSQQTKACIN